MRSTQELSDAVKGAWADVKAPPAKEMVRLLYEGEDVIRAFTGVDPMNVDIAGRGFLGATILYDLPPNAAAAYLGTYIVSFLKGLLYQERVGPFHDVMTRAHLLTCLKLPEFWRDTVSLLDPERLPVFLEFCEMVVEKRDMVALSDDAAAEIARKIAEYR